MRALVLAEHDNRSLKPATACAVTAARQLGGAVDVLVVGGRAAAAAEAAAALQGVEKVLLADDAVFAELLAEPAGELIVGLAPGYDALLAPATAAGKNIMPRVAALLDVQQVSEIVAVLAPDTFPLQIMIEFPDGLERDLVYTRLFVNNMLVDENTAAPFDAFDWDISQIVESGDYTISATIEDSVGFIVETIELPVKVVIEPKPQTWLGRLFSAFTPQAITLFVIIVFAGILLTGMAVRTLRQNRTVTQTKMRKLEDPLTQPVLIEDDLILPRGGTAEGEAWPHVPGQGLAPARLMLQSPRSSAFPAEISILDGVTTIGSDPKKAKFVIPSHLVSSLHARITKDEEDLFRLQDEGSGSGTWLNYAPVSAYGARLLHGDLIQFGNVSYRFEIHSAKPGRMTVEKLEDDE